MVRRRSGNSRQKSLADQLARVAELDALRLQRALTASEQAEADRLADRAYHRQWRALQREAGAMFSARLTGKVFGMNGGAE